MDKKTEKNFKRYEEICLSHCIFSKRDADFILSTMKKTDFNDPLCRDDFNILKRIGVEFDLNKFHEYSGNDMREVDDRIDYLRQLYQEGVDVKEYSNKLKNRSLKTHAVNEIGKVLKQLENPKSNFLDVSFQAVKYFNEQSSSMNYEGTPVVIGEIIDDVVYRNKDQSNYFKTSFEMLDNVLGGGFKDGAVHVICARTGIGKTSLAQTFLQNMVKVYENFFVGLISLEMLAEEIAERSVSMEVQETKNTWISLRNNRDSQWLESMKPYLNRFVVIDSINPTIVNVLRAVRTLIAKGCRVICIDYFQLIRNSSNTGQTEFFSEVSSSLIDLARREKVAILLLAQLNREANKGGLGINSIRSSDALASDCYTCLTIQPAKEKAGKYDDLDDGYLRFMLQVEKNRGGQRAGVPVRMKRGTYHFESDYSDEFDGAYS